MLEFLHVIPDGGVLMQFEAFLVFFQGLFVFFRVLELRRLGPDLFRLGFGVGFLAFLFGFSLSGLVFADELLQFLDVVADRLTVVDPQPFVIFPEGLPVFFGFLEFGGLGPDFLGPGLFRGLLLFFRFLFPKVLDVFLKLFHVLPHARVILYGKAFLVLVEGLFIFSRLLELRRLGPDCLGAIFPVLFGFFLFDELLKFFHVIPDGLVFLDLQAFLVFIQGLFVLFGLLELGRFGPDLLGFGGRVCFF